MFQIPQDSGSQSRPSLSAFAVEGEGEGVNTRNDNCVGELSKIRKKNERETAWEGICWNLL